MTDGFANSPILFGATVLGLPLYKPSLFFSVKSGFIAPVLFASLSENVEVDRNPS
jgi:hypothetical protein